MVIKRLKAVLLFTVLSLLVDSLLFADETLIKSEEELKSIDVVAEHVEGREVMAKGRCLVHAPSDVIWKLLMDDIDQTNELFSLYLFSRVISEEKMRSVALAETQSFKEMRRIIGEEKIPISKTELEDGDHGKSYYFAYLVDTPWPVANRWGITKNVDRFDPLHNSYSRHYTNVAGNMVKSEGFWVVRPSPDHPGWAEVTLETYNDSGIWVPQFILKPSARSVTKDTLEELQEKAGITP